MSFSLIILFLTGECKERFLKLTESWKKLVYVKSCNLIILWFKYIFGERKRAIFGDFETVSFQIIGSFVN